MDHYNWDFFIAYAKPDEEIAERLFDYLSEVSRVFIATKCIPSGVDWDIFLKNAQKQSLVTIALISSYTEKAHYQREEILRGIELAKKSKHTVIPVYLDIEANIGNAPYGLANIQGYTVTKNLGLKEIASAIWENFHKNPLIKKYPAKMNHPKPDEFAKPESKSSSADMKGNAKGDNYTIRMNLPRPFVKSEFENRTKELKLLQDWVSKEPTSLILIYGLRGVGKTSLAIRFAHLVKSQFQYAVWLPLANAPAADKIFSDCIEFFSGQIDANTSYVKDAHRQISNLLHYMKEYKCLIILDDAGTVFSDKRPHSSCETYYKFLQAVTEGEHKSTVLIVSHEKPIHNIFQNNHIGNVRSLKLGGMEVKSVRRLLKKYSLHASDEAWEKFLQLFSGNPLLLNVASGRIADRFGSNIDNYLKTHDNYNATIFEPYDIIQQVITSVSQPEHIILLQLALQSPRSYEELIKPAFSDGVMLDHALDKLLWRSLIEINEEDGYFLLNIIRERVVYNLVNSVTASIQQMQWEGFTMCPLLQADAPLYVREYQLSHVIDPILHTLQKKLGRDKLINVFMDLLEKLRNMPFEWQGYAGGNIINMLVRLGYGFSGFNFSNLAIHQAFLADTELQYADFSNTDLSHSIFRETFNITLSCAYHYNGNCFATGDTEGVITIWKKKPLQKFHTIPAHTRTVWGLCFYQSHEGDFLASCSHDGYLRIWDISNFDSITCYKEFKVSETWLTCIDISGETIAVAGGDKKIYIYNTSDWTKRAFMSEGSGTFHGVKFSQDGKFLLAGDSLGYLHWVTVPAANEEPCINVYPVQNELVSAIAFHPKFAALVTSGSEGHLVVWKIHSNELIKADSFQAHDGKITNLAYSPDGKRLISSSDDNTIKVWEYQSLTKHPSADITIGHDNKINTFAIAPDNRTVVSCVNDDSIYIWDILKAKCINRIYGYCPWISSLALTQNCTKIVAGSADKTVKIWDYTDIAKPPLVLKRHLRQVNPIAISLDEKLIASGSKDGAIILWNAADGAFIKSLNNAHKADVRGLVFLNNSSEGSYRLISAAYDRHVLNWEIDNRGMIKKEEISSQFSRWLGAVTANRSKSLLAFVRTDANVQIYDTIKNTNRLILSTGTNELQTLAFSPDEKLLAAAGNNGCIYVWHTDTWKIFHKIHTKNDDFSHIGALAFSPDSKWLASAGGCGHGTFALWDIYAETNHMVKKEKVSGQPLHTVIFSEDGTQAITAGSEGVISIYTVPDLRFQNAVKNLRPYEGMRIDSHCSLSNGQIDSLHLLGAYREDEK